MCRTKAPIFSALAAPKDFTLSTWAAPKDPLFKNIQFFVVFFRPGQIEKTLVLKKNIYVSLLFLAKISRFSREEPLWKPHIFSEGSLP